MESDGSSDADEQPQAPRAILAPKTRKRPGQAMPTLDAPPSKPSVAFGAPVAFGAKNDGSALPKSSRVEELEAELQHTQNILNSYRQSASVVIGEANAEQLTYEILSDIKNDFIAEKKQWAADRAVLRKQLLTAKKGGAQNLEAVRQEAREVDEELQVCRVTLKVSQANLVDAVKESDRVSARCHDLEQELAAMSNKLEDAKYISDQEKEELKRYHEKATEDLKHAHNEEVLGLTASHLSDEMTAENNHEREKEGFQREKEGFKHEMEELKAAHQREMEELETTRNADRKTIQQELEQRYEHHYMEALKEVKEKVRQETEAELKEKLEGALKEELQGLAQNTLDNLQQRSTWLEGALEAAQNQNAEKDAQLAKLAEEHDANSNEFQQVSGELHKVKEERDSHERYIQQLEADLENNQNAQDQAKQTFDAQTEKANKRLDEYKSQMQDWQEWQEQVQQQTAQTGLEIEQLEQERANLKDAVEAAERRSNQVEAANRDHLAYVAQLRAEVQAGEATIKSQSEKEDELNNTIEASREEARKFKDEHDAFQNAINTLFHDVVGFEDDEDGRNLGLGERLAEAFRKQQHDLSTTREKLETSEEDCKKLKAQLEAAKQPAENTLNLETALNVEEESIAESIATADQGTNTEAENIQSIPEVQELKNQVTELEQEKKDSQKTLEDLRQETANLAKAYEQQVDQLHQQLTTLEHGQGDHENDLKSLHQEKANLQQELDRAKHSSEETLATLRQQMADLEEKHNITTAELESLRQEKAELVQSQQRSEETLATLRQQMVDLEEKHNATTAELDSSHQEKAELYQRLADSEDTLAALHQQIADLEEKLDAANDKLESLRQENTGLYGQKAELVQAKQHSEDTLASLRQEMAKRKEENDYVKLRRDFLESEIERAEQENSELEVANEKAKIEVARAKKERQTLEDEQRGLRHQIEEHLEQVRISEETVETREQQMNDLTAQIYGLRHELDVQSEARRELEETEAHQKIKELNSRIEDLREKRLAAEQETSRHVDAFNYMDALLVKHKPGYVKGSGMNPKTLTESEPPTPPNAAATMIPPLTTIDIKPGPTLGPVHLQRYLAVGLFVLFMGLWSGVNSMRAFYLEPNRVDGQVRFASNVFAAASPFEPASLLGMVLGVPIGVLQWFLGGFFPHVGSTSAMFPNAFLVWAVCALMLSQINVQASKKIGAGVVLAGAVLFGLYRQMLIDEADFMPYYSTAYLGF